MERYSRSNASRDVKIPDIILDAIAARQEDDPPNEVAIAVLKWYFRNNGSPDPQQGGFLDHMERLGVPSPPSKDELVHKIDHNVYFGDGQVSEDEFVSKLVRHRSRVRLIRYGEFIQNVEIPTSFTFENVEKMSKRDDLPYGEGDVGMTSWQLEELGKGFVSGFYSYINQDRILKGTAAGAVNAGMGSSGERLMRFRISEESLVDQFEELQIRYCDERRPLGSCVNTNIHLVKLKLHFENLFKAVTKCLDSPCASLGGIMIYLAELLVIAVHYDLDVARALVSKTDFLKLCEKILLIATEADLKNSQLWIADTWWLVYEDYIQSISEACVALTVGLNTQRIIYSRDDNNSIDARLADKFVDKHFIPFLLKRIQSKHSAESAPAFKALERVVLGSRHDQTFKLVRENKVYNIIKAAALASETFNLDEPVSETRTERRNRINSVNASVQATYLLSRICQRGIIHDNDPNAPTPMQPSKIVTKMTQRGVVPLLLKLARSRNDLVAVRAMTGLGEISRLKDCRQIMFQNGGFELVREAINSDDGNKVSQGLIISLHLLWDEEWRELFMRMEPPIETTVVQWAAYCMKDIRERSYEARQQIEQEGAQEAKKWLWTELEDEQGHTYRTNVCLSRCMFVLATLMHHVEAPTRLVKAGALDLAASCLDVPTEDACNAAFALLSNLILPTGDSILPELFTDPEHVLRAIGDRFMLKAIKMQKDKTTDRLVVFVKAIQSISKWRVVLEKVANEHADLDFVVKHVLGQTTFSACDDGGPPEASSPVEASVNDKCNTLTGKLRSCSGCGRLEEKRNQFRLCSRCGVEPYCGKTCQVSQWKQHKKVCKKKEGTSRY